MKSQLAIKFAELVYNGQWFTPLREALSAFVDKTQETVKGKVRLKLYIKATSSTPASGATTAFTARRSRPSESPTTTRRIRKASSISSACRSE
jgi:argininosuccinate synthase